MFPSTQLVFTKSCRFNFSTSGSSSNSGIDDGGQRESGRTPPTAAAGMTRPHRYLRGGELHVLFRLNFYPGGGGVNHTIAYLRRVHPLACEHLPGQSQVLIQVQVWVHVLFHLELLVLLKNKKNCHYIYILTPPLPLQVEIQMKQYL